MTWVRLDDTFPEREDMLRAGALGLAMHVAATCYCNRNLTNGVILRSAVRRLLDVDDPEAIAASLVHVGTWLATDDGYRLLDYFPNQPSAETVRQLSATRADAGRKGGKASGQTRRAQSKQPSSTNGQANPRQVASSMVETNAKPGPSPRDGTDARAKRRASPPTPDELRKVTPSQLHAERSAVLAHHLGATALDRARRDCGPGAAELQVIREARRLLDEPVEPSALFDEGQPKNWQPA
jgi:hypothetical protein